MIFYSYLDSVINVSSDLKTELAKVATRKTIEKGETLIQIGERCDEIYFIENGLLRGYYYLEGKEITNWFAQEGEFATCFYSFIVQKNSFETIQALEDTELIQISFSDLQALYKNYPETERLGRILTEIYYIRLEERLLNIQFKSAKERYSSLLENRANLLKRAPLGQIASYLGITQETLSRMRADL